MLENPLANGECGQISNLGFGTPTFTNSFDSALMGGWGVRPSDWGFVASVQQQLVARTSVEFNYTRRWLNNFVATDNLATVTGDYRPFSVVAPTDSRLGAASGTTIGDRAAALRSTQAAATAVPNNFATLASNLGATQYQHFNGFLMNVQSRVKSGLTLSGGFNTGKTVERQLRSPRDHSGAGGRVDDAGGAGGDGVQPVVPSRHRLGDARDGAGVVHRPEGRRALSSTTFRSDQGGLLAANWTIPLATAQAGGLVGTFANNVSPTVNLVQPGTLYGDRVNELDFKIAKIVRLRRHAPERGPRDLQRVERQRDVDLQPDVQPGGCRRVRADGCSRRR